MQCTSTQARANISEVLGAAIQGEPVEITRSDGYSAVVINTAGFDTKLNAEFDEIMLRHKHTIAALTNR